MPKKIDFIVGPSPKGEKAKSERLSLCYGKPTSSVPDDDSVIQFLRSQPRNEISKAEITNDGLYISEEGPLTSKIVKPYKLLSNYPPIITQSLPQPFNRLLNVAVRDVIIHGPQFIEITSVMILYKKKVVCKMSSPFNRKLYKLLIANTPESVNNFSLKISSRNGSCSILPLFVPKCCVTGKKTEIDFSISENGIVYSGTLLCTISISVKGDEKQPKATNNLYKLTNDPNDPQNNLSLMKAKSQVKNHPVKYFLLQHPSLVINNADESEEIRVNRPEKPQVPNVVVLEQPVLKLKDLSIGNVLEAKRPLRPSSGPSVQKIQQEIGRDEALSVTILRGVQMPVREDSRIIHPMLIVTWGGISQATKPVEGVTPVWHQTLHFGMPKSNRELIKLSLFDQHPVWGLQWLGETSIPLEFQCNHQELEKWINLSPIMSPVLRFGYKSSTDISHTRIYIVIKLKKSLTSEESSDKNTIDVLAKTIQRCLVTPYKLSGIDDANEAAKLVMLLNPLPARYGPLNPRQALKLNKVDYYGRAALLAALLQGLNDNLHVYVVLGVSQARKWAVFVVTVNQQNTDINIWDPENGEHYNLSDSRCSLIRIARLINHQHIWKNLQNATILSNLRFNVKSSKDWQQMNATTSSTASREAHILDLEPQYSPEEIESSAREEIEIAIREKISKKRSKMGFITIFNPHADGVLRKFLTQFLSKEEVQVDNSDFNQLLQNYHTYGFILNLRYATKTELIDFFLLTKIHETTGPVEFALVCDTQRHAAKVSSFWLAVIVLRSRE